MEIKKPESFKDILSLQQKLDDSINSIRTRTYEDIKMSLVAECVEFNEETIFSHKTWKTKEYSKDKELEELTDIYFFFAQLINYLDDNKNEALKVWVFKALKTERFIYTDVHSDEYGSELETNIGTIYHKTVKDALMINQIRDTLLVNPYITECYNFVISNEDEYVPQITFNVKTVYGELEMEV